MVRILLILLLQLGRVEGADINNFPDVDGVLHVLRQIVGNQLYGFEVDQGFEFGQGSHGLSGLSGCRSEVYYLGWGGWITEGLQETGRVSAFGALYSSVGLFNKSKDSNTIRVAGTTIAISVLCSVWPHMLLLQFAH